MKKPKRIKKYSVHYTCKLSRNNKHVGYIEKIYLFEGEDEKDLKRKIKAKIRGNQFKGDHSYEVTELKL